jgi:hypothetical protein
MDNVQNCDSYIAVGVRCTPGCPFYAFVGKEIEIKKSNKQTNCASFSPQAKYTDWAAATSWWILVLTFADRGVSHGQRDGTPTAVNPSFLDRSRYFK